MHTLNDISSIKTNLVESLEYEMRCKGTDNMDICATGQIVDMIKDLAQAEKDCMEKCYYESVVGAMDEYGFENEIEIEKNGRAGYDTRRYASGRYAPKGHGHYSPVHGYTPMHHPIQAHMPMTDYDEYDSMGYARNVTGKTSNPRMGYPMDEKSYEEYDKARRHYHETKDSNEKMKMEHHADQYIHDVTDSIRDMWDDATPEMKKKIKGDMSKLLAGMTV